MDPSGLFGHMEGVGTLQPRLPQSFPPRKPINLTRRDQDGESEAAHRIAHTLTACCRCRQRKTRCDPTLPRCLPCERSGSICEYFDTTKNKKISRYYVVKLQEKVRALEAELGQYTEEEDFPKSNEDILRPGGLVRLNESDETPRYLGPSSGIAMTRILMEEAKHYTDSKRISELIPEVRVRRQAAVAGAGSFGRRSQSFSMPPPTSSRKKSYPMISGVPAENLPSRGIADRLVEVFFQRAQVFTPTLHEKVLREALIDVYNGSQDPYKQFVVRMVMAISMQKLDTTYAGLADSYYLAAMQRFEDVVRPKDLKTLQCLILIGQYSMLTPTRTAVYYIVGLMTKISQQIGLADEKTIAIGTTDPMTLDMRRRLSWIVITMESGLAYSMGRPYGFAKTDDAVDVKFFNTARDENITELGILPGPVDENKLVAIHFCKMRIFQAQIRRALYEKKQPEPKDDRNPWFASMEAKLEQWLHTSPENPAWCKPWFSGRYHTMIIALHRPSPQVPKPSSRSAVKCFDSAAFVINISSKQMRAAAVDITWIFLITLYMSVNAILWSVASFPEIRAAHTRDEVQELINVSLDIIDQCAERWPGTSAASQIYSILARACLQSYEAKETPILSTSSAFGTPHSQTDTNSPSTSDISSATTMSKTSGAGAGSGPGPAFNPPQFGYVFDQAPESVTFDDPFPPQPTFRSNSIFLNPASTEPSGRRFSYFPPDFTQSSENLLMDDTTPPGTESTVSPPLLSPPDHHSTPPESISGGPGSVTPLMATPLLSNSNLSTPNLMDASSAIVTSKPLPPQQQQQQQQQQRPPHSTFTVPPLPPQHHSHGQRTFPPPPSVTDWFRPPPPIISPYAFGGMNTNFWGDSTNGNGLGVMGMGDPQFNDLPPQRQGSLSHAQQLELLNILEDEGMNDIDMCLNLGINFNGGLMGSQGSDINWAGS